jgi:hypothetical protein
LRCVWWQGRALALSDPWRPLQGCEFDASSLDEPSLELLRVVRGGGSPLDAYGADMGGYRLRLAAALGKVLVLCESTFGGLRITAPGFVARSRPSPASPTAGRNGRHQKRARPPRDARRCSSAPAYNTGRPCFQGPAPPRLPCPPRRGSPPERAPCRCSSLDLAVSLAAAVPPPMPRLPVEHRNPSWLLSVAVHASCTPVPLSFARAALCWGRLGRVSSDERTRTPSHHQAHHGPGAARED